MVEEERRAAEEAADTDDPVEAAGETTAANLIGGPADTRPVGTGTLVEVEGDPAPGESAEGSGKTSGVTAPE